MNGIFHQVFIYSIGSAVLPFLAYYVSRGNLAEMKNTLRLGIRVIFYILLPVTVMILILCALALLSQVGFDPTESWYLTNVRMKGRLGFNTSIFRSMPSGFTLPSRIGRVRGPSVRAIFRVRRAMWGSAS